MRAITTTTPRRAGPNPDGQNPEGEARQSRSKAPSAPRRNFRKCHPASWSTLLDFVRYAVSRFTEAKLTFAHGTPDPVEEAIFLVCETLHLHPERFETFAARGSPRGAQDDPQIDRTRVSTRKPAAYLVGGICMAACRSMSTSA